MKVTEELRSMMESFPFMADLLEAAAQRIEDQRLWRGAWLEAESRVELLTREINVLRSQLQHRKEKG